MYIKEVLMLCIFRSSNFLDTQYHYIAQTFVSCFFVHLFVDARCVLDGSLTRSLSLSPSLSLFRSYCVPIDVFVLVCYMLLETILSSPKYNEQIQFKKITNILNYAIAQKYFSHRLQLLSFRHFKHLMQDNMLFSQEKILVNMKD